MEGETCLGLPQGYGLANWYTDRVEIPVEKPVANQNHKDWIERNRGLREIESSKLQWCQTHFQCEWQDDEVAQQRG